MNVHFHFFVCMLRMFTELSRPVFGFFSAVFLCVKRKVGKVRQFLGCYRLECNKRNTFAMKTYDIKKSSFLQTVSAADSRYIQRIKWERNCIELKVQNQHKNAWNVRLFRCRCTFFRGIRIKRHRDASTIYVSPTSNAKMMRWSFAKRKALAFGRIKTTSRYQTTKFACCSH